jgi:hypothetical protein
MQSDVKYHPNSEPNPSLQPSLPISESNHILSIRLLFPRNICVRRRRIDIIRRRGNFQPSNLRGPSSYNQSPFSTIGMGIPGRKTTGSDDFASISLRRASTRFRLNIYRPTAPIITVTTTTIAMITPNIVSYPLDVSFSRLLKGLLRVGGMLEYEGGWRKMRR